MSKADTNFVIRVAHKLLNRSLHSGIIWYRLPASFRSEPLGLAYGSYLHTLVCRYSARRQNNSTLFFRNRAELAAMRRLIDQSPHGASVNISVLACSKGAEVYSILQTIRSARPDLRVQMHAVDIDEDVINFARRGIYSLRSDGAGDASDPHMGRVNLPDLTWKDQSFVSPFARITSEEGNEMFDVEGGQAKIKECLKEGITWVVGDAADPKLAETLGPQGVVVANRFLCHMLPREAESCLRNLAQVVEPGGHLFVSGIDLDVRTKVALDLGWQPATDMIREVHEGDPTLTQSWPLSYWGLEPFRDNRSDWKIRYASVFQIGEVCAETIPK